MESQTQFNLKTTLLSDTVLTIETNGIFKIFGLTVLAIVSNTFSYRTAMLASMAAIVNGRRG